MARAINFNTIKKQYLTVTLADEKKTTLLVGTPTKELMDELIRLQSDVKEDENENNEETLDDLYLACARVMSRNKGGIKVDKKLLEKNFDFEDIKLFFEAYMDFLGEVMGSKN